MRSNSMHHNHIEEYTDNKYPIKTSSSINNNKSLAEIDKSIKIKLGLDKLVIAFPVSKNRRNKIQTKLNHMFNIYHRRGRLSKCKIKKGYKNTYSIRVFNRKYKGKKKIVNVTLSYNPINDKRPFLLLEFNVNKIKKPGKRLLRKLLINVLGKKYYYEIIHEAYLRRIEICIDIFGININNLLMYKLDSRRCKLHKGKNKYILAETCLHTDADGKIQTIYFNSQKSRFYICAYDKKTEGNKKIKRNKRKGSKLIEREWTRIESVLRNNTKLVDLPDMRYPALQLLIPDKSSLDKLPKEWQFSTWKTYFMDSCARRSFHNAVRMLPKPYRRSFQRKLGKMKPYIDLEKIFKEQWHDVIKKLDFLTDKNF